MLSMISLSLGSENKDVNLASEAILETVKLQSAYEAKEEIRNEQIKWLKFQNTVLVICLAATTI